MRFLIFLTFLSILPLNYTQAQNKIVIDKAEDLPKYSYNLSNKDAVEIVQKKEQILKLATILKKDILSDLQKYDIRENATLRDYYEDLRTISVIEGDYNKALEYIQKGRELTDKESEKIILGLEIEAVINAIDKISSAEPNRIGSQITHSLLQKLNSADFALIQGEVEYLKSNTEIYSKNFLLGIVKSEDQPALNNNQGAVPKKIILNLIYMHYYLNYYIPYIEAFNNAYTNVLAERGSKIEKQDIWKNREVIIPNAPGYTPVTVAVWDTGVDMAVFPKENRWINTNEKIDGIDNDCNGFQQGLSTFQMIVFGTNM